MSNTIVLDEAKPAAEKIKTVSTNAHCRFCNAPLSQTFVGHVQELQELEDLYSRGNAPWTVWNGRH